MKIGIFFVLILTFFIACSSNDDHTPENVNANKTKIESSDNIAEDITAEHFKSLMGEEVIILDVRTPEECKNGMIEGAININFNAPDFESKTEALDKNKTVLVYCAAGGRSGRAKNLLHANNFKAVYNLKGGYSQWPYKD